VYHEPFGITPRRGDALRCSRHYFRQSGVAEVVNHVIKVDFWNVDELANAMISVLRRPALAKRAYHKFAGGIETITWDRAAEKILGVYRSLKG